MSSNPALAQLQFLVGAWDMELSDASFLPDPNTNVSGSMLRSAPVRRRSPAYGRSQLMTGRPGSTTSRSVIAAQARCDLPSGRVAELRRNGSLASARPRRLQTLLAGRRAATPPLSAATGCRRFAA
jgi:hypothetical protein